MDEELAKLAKVLTKNDGTHWQEVELETILERTASIDTSAPTPEVQP